MATSSKKRNGRRSPATLETKAHGMRNRATVRHREANEARPVEQAVLDKLHALYPNGHPRFLETLIEEARLHHNKNHDYAKGGTVFGNFERVAAILRLYPGFPYDTREGVNVTYLYVIWNTRRTLIQEELHGAL